MLTQSHIFIDSFECYSFRFKSGDFRQNYESLLDMN